MIQRALIEYGRKTGLLKMVKWCLRKINYRRTEFVNGVRLICPSIRGITCRSSEPWMVGLLRALLPETPGIFLDVGVNLGQTLIKVKAVDRHRKYIGFEPNPSCVFYIRELIRENCFQNCTLLPVGLFTADGILLLDFFSDDPTEGAASMIHNFRPNSKVHSQIPVPVFRFNTVVDALDINGVGVVKIDVEGAELEVVKSLLDMIRQDRPTILMEVLPAYSLENATRLARQKELERLFADASFTIFRVEKTRADGYAGLKRIDGFGIHSDLRQCDYVIVPNERSERLHANAKTPDYTTR